MLKKNILVILSFLLINMHETAYSVEQPGQKLQAFLKASKSLTADFKQVLINESGNPYQTSYGIFYLQRPGKFRWDYQKPFQQQIVSTLGKVWFYDTDLDQVTVKKLDESVGSTPALLLSGNISIEDNFTMQDQGIDGDLSLIHI